MVSQLFGSCTKQQSSRTHQRTILSAVTSSPSPLDRTSSRRWMFRSCHQRPNPDRQQTWAHHKRRSAGSISQRRQEGCYRRSSTNWLIALLIVGGGWRHLPVPVVCIHLRATSGNHLERLSFHAVWNQQRLIARILEIVP